MKNSFQGDKHSGMALVIVLCFLIIISGLIVAFFGSVTTELAATKSYSAGVTARQLSDMATNLVMAQIRDATRGYQTAGVPASGVLSWASQPGMIRTYDDTGAPYAYYKLYSSGNMLLRNLPAQYNVNDEFDSDVPKTWASQTGIYTDLNAPVVVPDPNGGIKLNGATYRLDYPILDPSAAIAPAVEGLTIGTIGDPSNPAPVVNPNTVPNPNPAALPCRWLYVLKDGSTISPSNSTNGKVTFENSEVKPTATNPIVGRMAFWTDDESTKVNVNTAGEGTFWDIPRSQNPTESNFETSMPAQNEFQRLPGHPAMTCLSTVFENLGSYWSLAAKGGSYATAVQRYLNFAPRLEFGGSQAGSAAVTGTTSPIVADHDRLFASLDELAFDVRYKGTGGPAPTRAQEANLTREDIQKVRFFLTTSSRAPETNLFNLPRICLWPIQKEPAYQSAKEQLIAFCTSTGSTASGVSTNYHPYYFQRLSTYTGDGRLSLTNPPPSSQSGWEDFALSSSGPVGPNSTSSRNAVLYKYLQNLTSRNIPGFGGSFKQKYDAGLPAGYSDRDQILTEMYDMNRSGLNSYTSSGNLTYFYAGTHSMSTYSAGESQVVPEVITTSGAMNPTIHDPSVTKGFGRFMTFPEVAVIFFSPPPSDPVPTGNEIVKAAVVVGLYNPTPGIPCWSPNLRYTITGLKNFTINGQSLNLPDVNPGNTTPPCNVLTGRVGFYGGGNHNTSVMGLPVQFSHFVSFGSDAYKTVGNDGTDNTFPFVTPARAAGVKNGGAVLVSTDPAAPKTMRFSGGTIQIQIFAGYESVPTGQTPKQLIQTLNIQFPPCPQCPIPDPTPDDFNARMTNGTFIEGTANSTNTDLTKGDVIRSMQVPSNGRGATASNAAMGDLRILAAIPVVPTTMFKPHPDYLTLGKHAAHNLRTGAPGYYAGGTPTDATGNATKTALVPGQKGWTPEPIAAPGQVGALGLTGQGDFDNGYGVIEDGAYINKPDEGDSVNGGQVYFSRGSQLVESGATYAPNRQASSAVMFGSLPTGVKATEAALYGALNVAGRPWQTLLFCANPANPNHPGFGTPASGSPAPHSPPYKTPPDHLWLDLFTMPVVEPYAISEPFSTAGKINLNYQIAPFRYITRSTGVRAVMKSTQLLAIPTADPDRRGGVRYPIEVEPQNQGTLIGFENIFNRGDIFRSASQICDIPLVPKGAGASYNNMAGWWTKYLHTGDNAREQPYGHIYPRVTTKSNVFTVHVWVQALQKSGGAQQDPTSWDETKDRVISEYRGSNIVERYIDASDPNLPDFAASSPTPPPIDNYYKFRVVSSKRFVP